MGEASAVRSADNTKRGQGVSRGVFVAALAEALDSDPEVYEKAKARSVTETLVRGLIAEAQRGRASAIRLIFYYLDAAEREEAEPLQKSPAKRTESPKAPIETSTSDSGRMREAELQLRAKLSKSESGEEGQLPEASGNPVDLETARRVVDSLRAQKCDSPAQEELRRRFLRLAEAELEERERHAASPAADPYPGTNREQFGRFRA